MASSKQYSKFRENPETERAGLKWTSDEDEELLDKMNKNISLEDIAKQHKRTVTGIKYRIIQHGIIMMENENISINDVSKKINIPVEEIQQFQQKQADKKKTKQEKKSNNTDNTDNNSESDNNNKKYMDILIEIRNLLQILVDKKT